MISIWVTSFTCAILMAITYTHACNEAVCASVVSKCLLVRACRCDTSVGSGCVCCKECFACLGHLYADCCSCVEMCPKKNETESSYGDDTLRRRSHVESFAEPLPALFQVLVDGPDEQERWTTVTYPVHTDIAHLLPKTPGTKHAMIEGESSQVPTSAPGEELISLNCTVAFLSQCTSWNKCKSSCSSMGANSYRWFHDGCCECIGEHCLNYGIDESRCLKCPYIEDEYDDDDDNVIETGGESDEEDQEQDNVELGEDMREDAEKNFDNID